MVVMVEQVFIQFGLPAHLWVPPPDLVHPKIPGDDEKQAVQAPPLRVESASPDYLQQLQRRIVEYRLQVVLRPVNHPDDPGHRVPVAFHQVFDKGILVPRPSPLPDFLDDLLLRFALCGFVHHIPPSSKKGDRKVRKRKKKKKWRHFFWGEGEGKS